MELRNSNSNRNSNDLIIRHPIAAEGASSRRRWQSSLFLAATADQRPPPRRQPRQRQRQRRCTMIVILIGTIIGFALHAIKSTNDGDRKRLDVVEIQYSHTVERLPAAAASSTMTGRTKETNDDFLNDSSNNIGGNGAVMATSSSSLLLAEKEDDPEILPIYLLRPLSTSLSAAAAATTTTTTLKSPSHTITHSNATSFPNALPESIEFALISWNHLSQSWNRTTNYHDLFPRDDHAVTGSKVGGNSLGAGAKFIPSLPFVAASSETRSSSSSSSSRTSSVSERRTFTPLRTIIILHASPKTGSTTLRTSCTDNLRQTCNATQSTSELRHHAPPGYYDENTFFRLLRDCVGTHHFCTKDILFFPSLSHDAETVVNATTASHSSSSSDPNSTAAGEAAVEIIKIAPSLPQKYPNTLLIHTFPFRTYDEWVLRALRQQYSRAQEAGCDRTKSLLSNNNCRRDNMELDIRKYSKLRLKNVWRSVGQRLAHWKEEKKKKVMRRSTTRSRRPTHEGGGELEEEEHHIFLLYQHQELHRTMQLLSDLYGIPTLPGLERRMKVNGQKRRRKKKKDEDEEEKVATATLERRKMSKLMTMNKEMESIARDGTNTTTASRIGDDEDEETTTTWCKEEEQLLIMFHDCFSKELMAA